MSMISTFFRILFSPMMLVIFAYILIGVFTNTAPPHIPQTSSSSSNIASIHSWVQYIISVLGWPLSYWGPTFTFGKWAQ